MSYYYPNLNIKKIETLATETGRLAHILRNYIQGFATISNPELLSLDIFAGNIETQMRQLKGQLYIKEDIKITVANSCKMANFLRKIFSADFYAAKDFNDTKLEKCRKTLNIIVDIIINMDSLVNKAIINQSKEINGLKDASDFEIIKDEINLNDFYSEFNKENEINLNDIEKEKNITQFKNMLCVHGEKLSNQSHNIQDLVSSFIHDEHFNECAKKIIGLAGKIEDVGREIILQTNTKINNNRIDKICDQSFDTNKQMNDLVNDKDFPFNSLKEQFSNLLKEQHFVITNTKKLIKCNYTVIKIK